MNTNHFVELGKAQSAVAILRQFNQYTLFPISELTFQNSLLADYFECPFGDAVEKKVEKIISMAGVMAIYNNPNIPSENKERSAHNTARDLRDAMRYAKIEYHAQEKDLSHKEYMRRKEGIPLVSRIAKIKTAKRIAKTMAISTFVAKVIGLSTGHGAVAGIAVLTARLTWKFIPEKVKKPITANAKEIKKRSLCILQNLSTEFKSTEIGKCIQNVIDVAKFYIVKTKDKVKPMYEYSKSYWPF